jgi:Protein of unknown function (DUF3043)
VRFLRRRNNPKPAESDSAIDQPNGTAQSQHGGAVSPGNVSPGNVSPGSVSPGSVSPSSVSPSKGRPTPKRREAEARRRGPVAPPPRTQREALRRSRGSKEDRRAERAERRARMLAGDDRYLLPRDRGPVRAYVRDLVDSRRHLMSLFLPLALVVLASIAVQNPAIQSYVSLATMAALLMIIVEGMFFGRFVTRRVREKFPDAKDSGLGLGWYAFSRATMLRRFRAPRPRVKYGEEPR